jgi:hypothetical protein
VGGGRRFEGTWSPITKGRGGSVQSQREHRPTCINPLCILRGQEKIKALLRGRRRADPDAQERDGAPSLAYCLSCGSVCKMGNRWQSAAQPLAVALQKVAAAGVVQRHQMRHEASRVRHQVDGLPPAVSNSDAEGEMVHLGSDKSVVSRSKIYHFGELPTSHFALLIFQVEFLRCGLESAIRFVWLSLLHLATPVPRFNIHSIFFEYAANTVFSAFPYEVRQLLETIIFRRR